MPDHAFTRPPHRRQKQHTGEVELRNIETEDLPAMFRWQKDPIAIRMAAFTPKDPCDRKAFISRWTTLRADQNIISRTILFRERPVGFIASFERMDQREVTYWIERKYWNKGIATHALSRMLVELEIRPIFARAAKDNVASLRVLDKCGFRVYGEERGFANGRGEEIEELVLIRDG